MNVANIKPSLFNMDQKMTEKLYESLKDLNSSQKLMIQLRFWENLAIEEIAYIMGLTWDEVDKTIQITLDQLRVKILESSYISKCAA